MAHRPLTDQDMALIIVLCADREAICDGRAKAAIEAGDKPRATSALTELWRYRSLRLKMFSPA